MFIVQANLDDLMSLPQEDEYLFFNYKWTQDRADDKNRVSSSFTEIEEAMAFHHELWKCRIPVFKNWI